MKFFYTGNQKARLAQQLPERSLGGYPSTSEIPDGLLSNLFDQISLLTRQVNKPEYRVIVIYNDDTVDYTNLKAWFDYEQNSDEVNAAYFELGYASMRVDSCGDPYVDRLGNGSAQPRGVTLSPADGVGSELTLANLPAGQYLAIYLKRVINSSSLTPRSDADLLAIMNQTLIPPIEEEVLLNFSWT